MRTLFNELLQFSPPVDLDESEEAYELSVDLPGLSKDDIKLELKDGQLVVSGERKAEKEEEGKTRHVTERYYGSFSRVFLLPPNVDADRVDAKFDSGVLKISVAKSESSKPRQIPIKAA
jgi:HSP20 family protein